MKRLLLVLALTAGILNPSAPAQAQVVRAIDSGVHTSCGGGSASEECHDDNGGCRLTGFVPDVVKAIDNPNDDEMKVESNIVCGSGHDRLKVGGSELIRFDCHYFTVVLSFFCDNPTPVADIETHWCGYQPTHPDAPSCDIVAWPNPGYFKVRLSWRYDMKDKDEGAECHAWQQHLTGSWTDDGVTHPFELVRTRGRLYGKDPPHTGTWLPCTGTVGTVGP